MADKIRLVCATRTTREEFAQTALGRSLAVCPYPFVELRLFPANTQGLPVLYNTAIQEAAVDPAILAFAHDDIYLCDLFWPGRVLEGLNTFDVLGIAGNRRRIPGQPAWHSDAQGTWDKEHLSGAVGHGNGFPCGNFSYYGPPHREVKLLDGVLLVARSSTLLSKGIRFDHRFDFHFYDMDFCRQAELQSLRMGTWSISVIHESPGAFGTPVWQAAYEKYLEKWGS